MDAYDLSTLQLKDANELVELINRNPEIYKWTRVVSPFTVQAATEFLMKVATDSPKYTVVPDNYVGWAIRDVSDRSNPKIIGCTMLIKNPYKQASEEDIAKYSAPGHQTDKSMWPKDKEIHSMPEGKWFVGYYVSSEYAGKGIMTWAVRAMIDRAFYGKVDTTVFSQDSDHSFSEPFLDELHGETHYLNIGSYKVLQKCGFEELPISSFERWRINGEISRICWLKLAKNSAV